MPGLVGRGQARGDRRGSGGHERSCLGVDELGPVHQRPVAAGDLEEQLLERPVHLDLVAELREGPVGQHPAPVDDPDRVGQLLGDREQVGRHQDGDAGPGLGEEEVLDDPGAPGVEADQGLVDDQDLRVVDQGRGEDDALLHPVGVVLGELVDVVAHLEGLDQLGDPPGRDLGVEAVHLDDEAEELAAGQLLVEIGLVGDVGDELAGLGARGGEAPDGDDAGTRPEQAADHLDRRGLARPVGPRKPNSSPARTLRSRWSTAFFGPNVLVTPRSSIMEFGPRAGRRPRDRGLAVEDQPDERERHFLAEDQAVAADPGPGLERRHALDHLQGRDRVAVPG